MRLILMGTGPFAVPTFRWLTESPHEVVAIVTRPVPEARGRRKGPANPVRDLLTDHPAPMLAPSNVNESEVVAQLQAFRADLMVVCDYGQILSSEALAATRLGGINLHGSLLPKYRGAAPINWALWNGEAETGVTVIHMTPRLDAGPCLTQARIAIGPDEDAVQLEERLAQLGIQPVEESLTMLDQWDGQTELGEIQDQTLATKAPRLKKSDGRVNWSQPATKIFNQVRALRPWPSTYVEWPSPKGLLRLILERVSVLGDDELPPDTPQAMQPGSVLASDGERLVVATQAGRLAIHAVHPAGKRVMPVSEFLRGNRIEVGASLGPPDQTPP